MSLEISSIRQQVSELLVVRASGHSSDSQRKYPSYELKNDHLKRLLEDGLGGVIFVGGSTQELQIRCKTLENWSDKKLLFCADVEEGVGQRFEGGTFLPPPMSLGNIAKKDLSKAKSLAAEYGKCIACQARSCGLNWILAPVCDINNNKNNPVINIRAWGEDPFIVSELVSSFQKGVLKQGVLTCAKHFPGHGDTTTDSHLNLPIVDKSFGDLDLFELIPFRKIISSGVNSIMTGHLLFPQIDTVNPATFSKYILTDILRTKLGFEGIIVTDALLMRAISKNYGAAESAVMAFEAGADLIMMPHNPDIAINAICKSIVSGRIPKKRLEESLERRRYALNLIDIEPSEITKAKKNTIQLNIQSKDHLLLSQEIIECSLEVKSPKEIKAEKTGINLIRTDCTFNSRLVNNLSPSICLPTNFGFNPIIYHQKGISPWKSDKNNPLDLEKFIDGPFIVQLFIRGNPFKGDDYTNEPWSSAIKQLQANGRLAGLFVYGSQYIWQHLSEILEPSIPSAYSPGQTFIAQQKLLSYFFPLDQLQKSPKSSTINEFTE